MQRVAHLFREVDHGVAAEDHVVACGRDRHAQQVARFRSAPCACSSGLACQPPSVLRLEVLAAARPCGDGAGVLGGEVALAGAGDHALVEVGADDLHARRSGSTRGRRRRACRPRRRRRSRRSRSSERPALGELGQDLRCAATSNWSSWRHRCETLIVTRSRKASSSSRRPCAGACRTRRGPACRGARSQVRTRRSIWLRLYCEQVDAAEPADELAQGDEVVGLRGVGAWNGGAGVARRGRGGATRVGRCRGCGCGEAHAPASRAIAAGSSCEREDLVGEAGLGHRARHAVDDAGRLGLDQDAAAGGLDGAGAFQAVLAHAGQDDQQHAAAVDAGGVGDREVGARAQAAHRGVVGQAHAAVAVHAQVRAAGGEQQARRGRRASPALASMTVSGETPSRRVGERGGEAGRHVLDDHASRRRAATAAAGSARRAPSGRRSRRRSPRTSLRARRRAGAARPGGGAARPAAGAARRATARGAACRCRRRR